MNSSRGEYHSEERLYLLLDGFEKLRKGSLLVVVGYVLIIASLLWMMASVATFPSIFRGMDRFLGAMTSAMIAAALTSLAGILLALAGFIVLLSSSSSFRDYSPSRLGRGSTAASLIAGGFAAMAFGLLLIIASAYGATAWSAVIGMGFIFLGILIAFIGEILFAVFIRDLTVLRDEGLNVPASFDAAGILLLLGVVLSVIPMIAPIGAILALIALAMIYKYSEEAINGLREQISRSRAGLSRPYRP